MWGFLWVSVFEFHICKDGKSDVTYYFLVTIYGYMFEVF